MFTLVFQSLPKEQSCFNAITEDPARTWHCRYGHLSYGGLKTLQEKDMVQGLPVLKASSKDVKFEDENDWDWHKTHQEDVIVDLELSNDTCNEVESLEDEAYNDDSCESAQEHSFADAERRIRKPPRWMDDYENGEGFSEDENITYRGFFCRRWSYSLHTSLQKL